MQHTPVLGGPAPRTAERTARKLASFALRHVASIEADSREWCLDVGCGNGFITTHLAQAFPNVIAFDVETSSLHEFQQAVRDQRQFRILQMSSDALGLPSGFFSLVTSFEVLEHVPDLERTVSEMVRVCRPGGVVAISVPQAYFPFENHGVFLNGRFINEKIPLLPYVRPLHRRIGAARVFSSGEMDCLFVGRGLRLLETGYASPQFERAAADAHSWEHRLAFLRDVLESWERTPVLKHLIGVSMLKAYRKPR